MPSPNNVLTADDYIQDSLVFQLDGIDYGGIDGQWLERVRHNILFDVNNRCVKEPYCYNFGGRSAFYCDTNYGLNASCSIDIVLLSPHAHAWQGLINSFNKLLLYIEGNIITNVTGRGQQCHDVRQVQSLHVGVDFIRNGYQINTLQANFNSLPVNKLWIGLQREEVPLYFYGSIYAIRIYNRQLSDREILINQKIDNARFGLGLNIPDEVLPATRSLSLLEPLELPDESESEQEPTNDNLDER